MFVSIILFAFAIFVVLLPWLWSRRQMYLLSWKLNGPFAFPIVGNALSFIRHKDNIAFVSGLSKHYVSPISVWLGTTLFVVVDNAADAEIVLASQHCLNKQNCYKYVREGIAADGLFTCDAAKWKQRVKLISPNFGLSSVYGHLPVFNKYLSTLVRNMSLHLHKGTFDIRPVINEATIDMILDTSLGNDVNADDKAKYIADFDLVQLAMSKRIFQPWYQLEWLWRLTTGPDHIRRFTQIHTKIFNNLIANRATVTTDGHALIDKLIRQSQLNPDFTMDTVHGECNTIMMAGSDTSAVTTATTLLMLAIHPSHQQRVYQELYARFGDVRDPLVTREDVESLQYLDWTIKETMRLFPIVAMISRENVAPIRMRGIDIPAGTSLVVNIQRVHRDPKCWGNDADVFNPSRFEPSSFGQLNPFCYLAFSGGPRNCVGKKYAMVALKVAVAKLLLNFNFTTHLKLTDVRTKMNINTQFLCKHMVEIHERELKN